MYISKTVTPEVKRRRAIELKIIRAVVTTFLNDPEYDFSLSVWDGEEHLFADRGTRDRKGLYDALYNTDEDYLNVWRNGEHIGWVRFIYGNDGWDVISDYTTNLEPYIGEGTKVDRLIEKYS